MEVEPNSTNPYLISEVYFPYSLFQPLTLKNERGGGGGGTDVSEGSMAPLQYRPIQLIINLSILLIRIHVSHFSSLSLYQKAASAPSTCAGFTC